MKRWSLRGDFPEVMGIIVLIFAIIYGLGYWIHLWAFSRSDEEPFVNKPQRGQIREEIDATLEDVDQSLEVTHLVPGAPGIEGGRLPITRYAIVVEQDRPDKSYLFKSERYIIDLGSGVEAGELCRAAREKLGSLSKIQKKDDLGVLGLEAGVEIPPVTLGGSWSGDIAGILARLGEVEFSELEVLVKGYADGNVGEDWRRNLRAEKSYQFKSILVLPQLDKESVAPDRFAGTPIIFNVDDPYGNRHLANLRAAFAAKVIVVPMLDACLPGKKTSVRILEGYIFDEELRREDKRKVDLYLNFY